MAQDYPMQQIPVNMDSTRSDLKPLLDQVNQVLQQVLDILQNCPDETANRDPSQDPMFNKVMYSRIIL
jgi:hypothetical protein